MAGACTHLSSVRMKAACAAPGECKRWISRDLQIANSSAQAQTINISRSTARADPIFGAKSIARVQAIDSAPKMRSVRSVEREISIICPCATHMTVLHDFDLQSRADQHGDRSKWQQAGLLMSKH